MLAAMASPQLRQPVERLDVVDDGAGMKLEADEQLLMLLAGKVRDVRPVRLDARLPLEPVDVFEVRQPSATREMRRAVAGCSRRAAGERDHAVDSEQRRQTDRVA